MLDLVTLGETMVAFIPEEKEYIRYAKTFAKKTAGAESNVAIGVAKLGHKAGWISKVGKDELGEFVIREVRGEGVDTSRVGRSEDAPTGVMFKQVLTGNETSVNYYRKNSAASTLCPEDIDIDYLTSAKILHISGVTPALSESCKETINYVVDKAKEKGMIISFDPNIRLKLWSKEEAKETLKPLLAKSDIVLTGLDEGEILLGLNDGQAIIEELLSLGVKQVAVKLGADGALVGDETGINRVEATKVTVVDNIGAGDAFSAGFLSGVIEGKSTKECGAMGCLMGAFAVSSFGDIEGLPDREAFERKRTKTADIYR